MRLVGLATFGAILAAGAWGTAWLADGVERFMNAPMNAPTTGYSLFVERGQTLSGVAERLATDSILDHPRYLAYYARWHERDRGIQAGEYLVEPHTTPVRLLEMMERGEVVQHRVRLIEGWSWHRALAEIQSHPIVEKTLDDPTAEELARRLGLPTPHPEGWFMPATYDFARGTTDLEVLDTDHRAMVERLDREWSDRSPRLPFQNAYEALIVASIVEKETAVADERSRIAGVFVRRLQEGMRLEADPTVIYGLGADFDGDLTRRDLRRDTPYNTYRRHGLPPTPIALPGAASLHATLHPADGKELFFVASEHGRHVFSRTYAEHRAAVDLWQRRRKREPTR